MIEPGNYLTIAMFTRILENLNKRINILESIEFPEASSGVYSDYASISAPLTLPTDASWGDIPGCSLSVPAGTYIVIGNFTFLGGVITDSLDDGFLFLGALNVDGVRETNQAIVNSDRIQQVAGTVRRRNQTISQAWRITLASTKTIKLQAAKSIVATGVSSIQDNTDIAVIGMEA